MSSSRVAIPFILVVVILYTSYIATPDPGALASFLTRDYPPNHNVDNQQSLRAPGLAAEIKVPLEIHIMSKCPDARDCLEQLIAPTLEEIESLVDFQMSFIGRPTADDGVFCMHGPSECLGNILHLCSAKINTPPSPPPAHTYLPFSLCLIHDFKNIPEREFVEGCADKNGIDFQKLNDCASDMGPDGGLSMLRNSVERSRALEAETSCTVRVDGKKRCVRDGGKWKDCDGGSDIEDLVRDIKKIYKEKNGGHERFGEKSKKLSEWIESERIIWTGH
ncbi:unnamed protein product [Tuber melanosporum]|jgi:hypothetical protein|uniref:(Perigord truffle) hypothetical protein n=1 Tax=Tuber melanosporum (strain Mel28) TaxID=656061 RepID=D5G5I7_TUBMM|nr:uncharacterized protein GSTUM_00004355001 [Tuber melanosporum]CAZ79780.1 unnamed protein product [Tuber melanosporum]